MVGLIVVEPDDTDSMLTYGLDDPFKARSPSIGAMPMFNKLSYLKLHFESSLCRYVLQISGSLASILHPVEPKDSYNVTFEQVV